MCDFSIKRVWTGACVVGLACLLCACAVSPEITPNGATSFSSLVASRSASVVDISTLRIGRDETIEGVDLEIAPEADFADRLAWPLPASVRVSQIRDLASGLV